MSNDNLVGFEQLKQWTGFSRRADVVRWLRENRVSYFCGRDGVPVTSIAAVDHRLVEAAKDTASADTFDF